MSVNQPLSADSQNVIRIFDESFDINLNYEIKLKERFICLETSVDVDDVSFCKDHARLTFEIPCISPGDYILEIIDKADDSVKYELTAKIY